METLRLAVGWTLAAVAFTTVAPGARAQTPVSEEDAFKLGTEAYIYGYPLITVEMTRRVMTNTAAPQDNHAPMGQFYFARTYPNASFKDVAAPNADTLYSAAWLNLAKGETPPVKGFWSLTMYNAEYFFVDNPLNRYTVSPRHALKYNADGSVDFYIQNESPGKDKESNWLPAPKGDLVLMMRLYWPQETNPSILNGTWQPPAAKMVAK